MHNPLQWYTVAGLLKLVENSHYREAQQPPGMTVELRPYQRQTLAWMLDHEAQPGGINACFWERRKVLDDAGQPPHEYYYCPLAGELLDKPPPVMGGGFVCEEMGLGKTVEALALVLARPAPPDSAARTTLIVVPQSLLDQWETEIEQRVEPGRLRTLVFNSKELAKHKVLSPDMYGYAAAASTPGKTRVPAAPKPVSLRKRTTAARGRVDAAPQAKVPHHADAPVRGGDGAHKAAADAFTLAQVSLPAGYFVDRKADAAAFAVPVAPDARPRKASQGRAAGGRAGGNPAVATPALAQRASATLAPALSWELRPGTFVVDAPFGAPLFSGPGAARKVWPADSDGRLSPAAVCFRPCGRLSHTAHAELVDLTRVGSTLWGRLVSPPTFDAGCQLLAAGLGTCEGNALRPVAWVPIQHGGHAPRLRRLAPAATWGLIPFTGPALGMYDIVLTTYEELAAGSKSSRQKTPAAKVARLLHSFEWYRVILDESQRLKNSRNVVSQAATDLRRANSWLLSGTPADGAVHDLVGQLVFLGVEPWCRMGKNVHNFWDGEITARWLERDPEILDTLQTLLSHIMMRHSKSQVGGRKGGGVKGEWAIGEECG